MKRRVFLACMILVLSAAVSNASPKDKSGPGYDSVIKDFIESHMRSNHRKLEMVMDNDANIKISRGESVIVQNRSNVVDELNNNEGTVQNCEPEYEVLGKSDAIIIARVDFKYENCVQHNYITLEKNENKQWKITQDCKIFDDIKTAETGGAVTAKN